MHARMGDGIAQGESFAHRPEIISRQLRKCSFFVVAFQSVERWVPFLERLCHVTLTAIEPVGTDREWVLLFNILNANRIVSVQLLS